MRLSEIKWQQHNKDTDRSQILFKPGTSTFYILMRQKLPGESAKPAELRTRYGYILYRDGHEIVDRNTDPALLLEHLWPHKMTPLEYKCWQVEQER